MTKLVYKPQNTRKPWVVRYRDPEGRQREQGFPSRLLAVKAQAEIQHQLTHHAYVDPATGNFKAAVDHWIEGRRAEQTRRLYRSVTKNHLGRLGRMTLAKVAASRAVVESVVAAAPPGQRGMLAAAVTGTVNDAVRRGVLGKHSLGGIGTSPAPRAAEFQYLSAEDALELAGRLPGEWEPVVLFARFAGLRLGEALGMTPSGVFEHHVRVSRQIDGYGDVQPLKGKPEGAYRDAPLAPVAAERLQDWTGYPRRPTQRRWRRAWNAVSDGYRFHDLRHCYATDLLGAGAPVTMVAKYLGHASSRVTEGVYGHVVPVRLGEHAQLLR